MFYQVKKIVPVISSVALIISIVSGFFWFHNKNGCPNQNIFANNSYSFVSVLDVNTRVSPENQKSQDNNREEKKSLVEIIFMINGMFVFTGITSKFLIIILGLFFIFDIVFSKGKEGADRGRRMSRLGYYKGWCVQFFSPIEESMRNRSDEYDINPMKRVLREKNPRFALSGQSAGFF